jgi:hypothetical protein
VNRLPAELLATAFILAVAACSAVSVAAFSASPRQASALPTLAPVKPVPTATPLPAIVPGPLDGYRTARAVATRRPIGFIVDNFSPDARPESGLSDASLVFETVVEGGVTRLMPIFLERNAPQVGPIRSARPYFVDWAAGYGAALVHAGGSPRALQLLSETPRVANVEALQSETQFYRLPNRSPPHNLFTSTAGARAILRQTGSAAAGPYDWLHFRRTPAAGGKSAVHIDFSTSYVSSPLQYAVTYRYDRRTNAYRRWVGGLPDKDANTGSQIQPANVAILYTSIVPIRGDVAGRVNVRDTGTGRAIYLVSGHVVRGSWSKRTGVAPLKFLDTRHKPVIFNPGTTWVDVVPAGGVRFGQ